MFLKNSVLLGLGVLLLLGLVESNPSKNELNAKKLVTKTAKKIDEITTGVASAAWQGYDLSRQTFRILTSAIRDSRKLLHKLWEGVNDYDYESFEDEELKRQMQLLAQTGLMSLDDEDFWAADEIRDEILRTGRELVVKKYPNGTGTYNIRELPEVLFEEDAETLEYYWEAVRHNFGEKVKDLFKQFVDFYRKAAANDEDVLKMHYRLYEDPHLFDEFTNVIEELTPFYKQLHALWRGKIIAKHGSDVQSPTGSIKEHLITPIADKMIRRSTGSNALLGQSITDKLAEWSPFKFLEVAREFYTSMGIEVVELDYSSQYRYSDSNVRLMDEKRQDPSCFNEVHTHYRDLKMSVCPQIDFISYLDGYKTMTEFTAVSKREELKYGLKREAAPGLEKAFGVASILSATSPKHLLSLELVDADHQRHLEALSGITLYFLFRYYAHEKFLVSVLKGEIAYEDYNCEYWRIQNEVAGIEAPNDRTKDQFDVPIEFFLNLRETNENGRNIFGSVLGYQLYKGFCEVSGEYEENNPEKTLQNCDYSGSHEVGKILSVMMSSGATKSWRKVIEPLIPDGKLDASAMLELFKPVLESVEKENKEKELHVGWDDFKYCQH